MTTPGELAEIFQAGWTAVPHSRGLVEPAEAVVMALQAMERRARSLQAEQDREAKEQVKTLFAPPDATQDLVDYARGQNG